MKLRPENRVATIILKMKENSSFPAVRSLRRKVAREAAVLLYTLQENEFKQAKERAAKDSGTRLLPTNKEVAHELDLIAEEREGLSRRERLTRMRKESLEIMETLRLFHPRLVGSVWRGTAHCNSDVDITVFSSNPDQVVSRLVGRGFKIEKTEQVPAMKKGQGGVSFHIIVNLPSGDEAEIVVRDPEEVTRKVRCEIYGDIARGLDMNHLRKVLKENPLQRFVPNGDS